MTTAARVRPGPATYTPQGMMRRLSRAALVIFDEVIWEATRFGQKAERITDRAIAEKTGYAMRTVQAAVHDLCSAVAAVVDGVEVMLLGRSFRYGPREECGRELFVTAPQVLPVEVPAEDPAPKPRAKPRARVGAGAYNHVPAPEPATPEELAAIARRAAAIHTEPAPATPEEEARAARVIELSRARREAREKLQAAARAARPGGSLSRDDQVRIERELARRFGDDEARIERELAIGMGVEKREPGAPDAHRRE